MRKVFFVLAIATLSLFAKVDINNAGVEELSTIKGIGKKRAEAIVKYREEHCFKDVSELVNIKGIGKKIVEKIKNGISVGECPAKEK